MDFSKVINWDRVNNLSDEEVKMVAEILHIEPKEEKENENIMEHFEIGNSVVKYNTRNITCVEGTMDAPIGDTFHFSIHTYGLASINDDLIENVIKAIASEPVYWNDLECYFWSYDHKMDNGLWVENIRYISTLDSVTCTVGF